MLESLRNPDVGYWQESRSEQSSLLPTATATAGMVNMKHCYYCYSRSKPVQQAHVSISADRNLLAEPNDNLLVPMRLFIDFLLRGLLRCCQLWRRDTPNSYI